MALARYEPWDVLNQLHGQINRIFDHQLDRSSTSSATADWVPTGDIEEYADRFLLKLDVPGIDVNAVEITLDQGVLTIAGERAKDANAVANTSSIERSRLERPHGRFHRRFTLPDTVDAAAVRAGG